MEQIINIGIIGDYDPTKSSHTATNAAIEHAARHLSIKASVTWLPTPSFQTVAGRNKLGHYDAICASSGSPYRSMQGAINAIKWAREMDRPFIGT